MFSYNSWRESCSKTFRRCYNLYPPTLLPLLQKETYNMTNAWRIMWQKASTKAKPKYNGSFDNHGTTQIIFVKHLWKKSFWLVPISFWVTPFREIVLLACLLFYWQWVDCVDHASLSLKEILIINWIHWLKRLNSQLSYSFICKSLLCVMTERNLAQKEMIQFPRRIWLPIFWVDPCNLVPCNIG